MARVDKTESAVGVVRGILAADLAGNLADTVIGVGLNASGLVVLGAGHTGIIGVMVPNGMYNGAEMKAGKAVDIFKLADIVECAGLTAGTKYWIDGTTGALVAAIATTGAAPASGAGTTAGSVYAGYTVEADRLILAGF